MVQKRGPTVTLHADKSSTKGISVVHLPRVLRILPALRLSAPELTQEAHVHEHGTVTEHMAPPQVPSPCPSPAGPSPDTAAATDFPTSAPHRKGAAPVTGMFVNLSIYFPSVLE